MRNPRLRDAIALLAASASLTCAPLASAAAQQILFVGNSYTFGRVDPVMSYNHANVNDLTEPFMALNATGSNPWEPHPWGGVPGIFKKFTDEAGLNYEVSISARNAASLRGQFLNLSPANSTPKWDMRGNVASQKWDAVVLQEVSDGTLGADRATFNVYADKFEKFTHSADAINYTEAQAYGSLNECKKVQTTTSCNLARAIPGNANANPNAKVFLLQTWARPDLSFAHLSTDPDPSTASGLPKPVSPNVWASNLPYASTGLAGMTADLKTAFASKAASNPAFAGVIPAGEAFQRAMDQGLAKSSGFYDASGIYTESQAGDPINLWWHDGLHASKYGSYLSALVQFGAITGLDPRSLGAQEGAAFDLGISSTDAVALQSIASQQLGFAAQVPEPASWLMAALGLGMLGLRRRQLGAA